MPILLLGIILIASGFIVAKASGATLPNVDVSKQGGKFKRDFDQEFVEIGAREGVPWALLKAHAIQESSLNASAFRDESAGRADRKGWASRGLMQILWWPGSERWKKFGFPDSDLADGDLLFDPTVNITCAARLIKENLRACGGNLRDAVNMYNAGVKESVREAPGNYVGKVLGYYSQLTNQEV